MHTNNTWIRYLKNRLPLMAVIVIISLAVLAIPARVSAFEAGIQTGPSNVCAGGCSCLPVSQAERQGYIPCYDNQEPCFHDSMDRPLYCYRPQSAPCQRECNATTIAQDPVIMPDQQEKQNALSPPAVTGSPLTPGESIAPAPAEPSDFMATFFNIFKSLFGLG
ncbi:MAG: hypothetical protein A4E35_02395 [Methanoregula sp. PtaU1.Bin051]|nr:MAG: hypothetical protein A4E35_02395 [Methanoregula sp. PtaU1.Bin051]